MDLARRRQSFGEVRSALSLPPGPDRWLRIEALSLSWPQDSFIEELWPYLAEQLSAEDGPRAAPPAICDQVGQSRPPAHLLLYDALDLSQLKRHLTNKVVAALAASPWAASLSRLSLANGAIGDAGLRALATSPHLPRLAWLNLWYTCPTHAGLAALGASTALAGLSAIEFSWIKITDQGFEGLVGSGGLPALDSLSACHGHLTDRSLAALITSGRLGQLKELVLIGHGFTNSGARLIAPHIGGLRVLALDHNDIGKDGLDALYKMPRLRGAQISCYPADSYQS
jgi:hypothetical protein